MENFVDSTLIFEAKNFEQDQALNIKNSFNVKKIFDKVIKNFIVSLNTDPNSKLAKC